MFQLPDELLIRTYKRAKQLNLSPDFIQLLKREIQKRSLQLSSASEIPQ